MKYRTIWISDVHLGTRGCQSDKLLSFLRENDADTIILIGDIIDFWSLKRQSYWPTEHNTVIQKLLKKARTGTKVVYIPGNHDEVLRNYVGFNLNFGNVELHEEYVHTLFDGREILCIHGDEFDIVTRYHKWLAVIGDIGYTLMLWLNRNYNKMKGAFGIRGHWSLASYLKHAVKEAVSFISSFEENVAKEVKNRGYDAVICGHIHHAEIKIIDGIQYLNDGDWVESCTSIVEHTDGKLEIIRWLEHEQASTNNGRVGTTS